MLLFAQATKQGVSGREYLLNGEGIALSVMGIFVVFAALALVSLFIKFLPRLMTVLDGYPSKQVETPKPATDELPEEILVVIAAAAAQMLAAPHRIVKIRGLTPEDQGWSMEGRMQHHTSHHIRPGNRR